MYIYNYNDVWNISFSFFLCRHTISLYELCLMTCESDLRAKSAPFPPLDENQVLSG